MPTRKSPIINIITSQLPGQLVVPMYQDFTRRFDEAKRMINRYDFYQPIRQNIDTVEYLLALSVFYNHVIANLDGAEKFHGTVTQNRNVDGISIGSYILNNREVLEIRRIIISYEQLLFRFSLTPQIANYERTHELLNRLVRIKNIENERDNQGANE